MLESASLLPSQGSLDLNPVAVAILVSEAEENYIGLFSEEFGFLRGMGKSHFLEWVVVGVNLLPDNIRSSHVDVHKGLSLLDLLNNLLMVLECMNLFEENLSVSRHLLRGL